MFSMLLDKAATNLSDIRDEYFHPLKLSTTASFTPGMRAFLPGYPEMA